MVKRRLRGNQGSQEMDVFSYILAKNRIPIVRVVIDWKGGNMKEKEKFNKLFQPFKASKPIYQQGQSYSKPVNKQEDKNFFLTNIFFLLFTDNHTIHLYDILKFAHYRCFSSSKKGRIKLKSFPDKLIPENILMKKVKILKAFSNPTRLRLINILMKGDRYVRELAKVMGVRESKISTQLSILKLNGVLKIQTS
jgi:hypothetical protein